MDTIKQLLSEEELKVLALDFLFKRELMTLATSSKDKVWAATTYYFITPDFEFIFYSRPDTRHVENIEKNPHVSVVVTEIPIHANKIKSIQMAGEARRVDGAEWNKYYPMYEQKYPWAKEMGDHIIYVIKPTEVWIIDEKTLGHYNRVQVAL